MKLKDLGASLTMRPNFDTHTVSRVFVGWDSTWESPLWLWNHLLSTLIICEIAKSYLSDFHWYFLTQIQVQLYGTQYTHCLLTPVIFDHDRCTPTHWCDVQLSSRQRSDPGWTEIRLRKKMKGRSLWHWSWLKTKRRLSWPLQRYLLAAKTLTSQIGLDCRWAGSSSHRTRRAKQRLSTTRVEPRTTSSVQGNWETRSKMQKKTIPETQQVGVLNHLHLRICLFQAQDMICSKIAGDRGQLKSISKMRMRMLIVNLVRIIQGDIHLRDFCLMKPRSSKEELIVIRCFIYIYTYTHDLYIYIWYMVSCSCVVCACWQKHVLEYTFPPHSTYVLTPRGCSGV